MRFKRGVYSEMGGDVVTFSAGGTTILPSTGKTEIVGRFPANMVVAEMVIERLWVRE